MVALAASAAGAVTFEFRQAAGLAGSKSAMAKLAADLRQLYGVPSVLGGVRTARLNVAVYRHAGTAGSGVPAR